MADCWPNPYLMRQLLSQPAVLAPVTVALGVACSDPAGPRPDRVASTSPTSLPTPATNAAAEPDFGPSSGA
jgi:hypothetical protein